ncbi:MAG: response regulator transcription factor [Deltaproteobacteria bacterium]|nr:response regulator transcription factor [Deltaproteobacteria bacterium]
MIALSDANAPASLDAVRVAVVTLVTTATTQSVVAELRRSAMHVDVITIEVLHAPPTVPVYVISVDTAIASVLADKLVQWAQASELRPGLIALVEDGGPRDCEVLLAAGFDDAVVAPISARELAGRVRAVHRRVHWKGGSTGRLRHGELTLDLYGRALWVDGKTITLTSIELAVVRELIKARGRPLSRVELLDLAWGEADLEISERAVDNVILRLRRKLPRPELIETVRSVGFRLAPRDTVH